MKILLLLTAGKLLRDGLARGKPVKYYAPTTLLQLRTLIPEELDVDVEMIDQGVDEFDEDFEADLLAISAITSAAPEAYRIAAIARSRGITVVMGGYHASACPEEALRYVDAVVIGYAEKTWPQLLRDFVANHMLRTYEDRSGDHQFSMPPLKRSLLDRKKYFTVNAVEATRGCPHQCAFCAVNSFTGARSMQRPVREVVEEIEQVGKRVLFWDPSPTDYPQYLTKLLKEITPLNISWYSAATLRLAEDPELLALMVKSGCKGVQIGFESINQSSLGLVKKETNRSSQYKRFIARLHDAGVSIMGNFMFGFDGDDASVFDRTIAFILDSKIDLLKLAVVTPLPGTPLYGSLKKQGRILSDDWERYDADHCVFEPVGMSAQQLESGCLKVYDEVYRFSSIFKRIIRPHADYAFALPANIALKTFRRQG
jgi:radical SAM superfamily enzyme YgiQ (UPF0313 family)